MARSIAQRKYYNKNKEKIKEQIKEYYKNNKEKIKEYYKNNKEKINEKSSKLQHEKQQLSNTIYDSIVEENDVELLEFAKSMGGKTKFKQYMLNFIITEKDYDKRFSKKKYENTPEHLQKLKQIYSKGVPSIEVEMLATQFTKQIL